MVLAPRPRGLVPAPALDAAQQRVVEHTGSPMLVLAGPGTGKTTTIVEAVVRRLDSDGFAPDQVAVLTFSRGAAAELRGRILGRLAGGGGQAPVVATFHSFAWQLLRAHAGLEAPRSILSEPEHLAFVRDVALAPDSALRKHWPEGRRQALESPGLIDELVSVLAAARAQGWEPDDLIGRAGADGPAEWAAVGAFFSEYLDVLDLPQGLDRRIDYSELVHRATAVVGQDDGIAGRFRAIYVDEFQDTDPAQVALLRALGTPRTTLVAVGDPDQAIYRFRGADLRGILQFPEAFPDAEGEPAPVVVLDHARRFGERIRAVADQWIAPVGLGELPRQAREAHRAPRCEGPEGSVEALTFRSSGAQAAGIADLLRRAHLDEAEPLPWSQMAVIVRAGADIARIRLALLQAGVPVEVPAADQPLASDPALGPFLTGLRLGASPASPERPPAMPGFEELESFLCSPLVGFTSLTLRRMLRSLRGAEKVRAAAEGRPARASAVLLAELLAPDAGVPAGLDDTTALLLEAIQSTLARMREPRTSVLDALWALWDHEPDSAVSAPRAPWGRARGGEGSARRSGHQVAGGRWARELYADALAGGRRSFAADAVLDAVNQLFRVAEDVPVGVGSEAFVNDLARQRVAAAPALAASFNRDGVRLLTAHRSKGLQWPLVVLVGLQQGAWPDARDRVTMLAADRIGPDGVEPPLSHRARVADERRLAFVAATRAERRLVLTAVASEGEDACPSELFDEAAGLDGVVASYVHDGTRRSLTPASLTAELRRTLQDAAAPPAIRHAAAARLALLAAPGPGGPVSPSAAPERWWGIQEPTVSDEPLAHPDAPVPLSASSIDDLGACALRWLLSRRAEASTGRTAAASYGSLIHAVAAAVIDGAVEPDVAAMTEALSTVFGELRYSAEWEADLAWSRAQADLARLAAWFAVQRTLAEMAAEVAFDTPAGADSTLRGSIDAVVRTDAGYRVVDFKTGKKPITAADAVTDVQLGVYQFAVASGGLGLADPGPPDGASLVYLGKSAAGKAAVGPDQRHQPPLTDDAWLVERIDAAAATVRGEQIVAVDNDKCDRCDVRGLCPLKSQLDWTAAAPSTQEGQAT